jgi:hypothetical protein
VTPAFPLQGLVAPEVDDANLREDACRSRWITPLNTCGKKLCGILVV